MGDRQTELRLCTIINILADQKNHCDLTKMFNGDDNTVKDALWDVVQGRSRGKPTTEKFVKRLSYFARRCVVPLHHMTTQQREGLATLNVRSRFTNTFKNQMAAGSVVTTDEEGEGTTESAESRRDESQLQANIRASRAMQRGGGQR